MWEARIAHGVACGPAPGSQQGTKDFPAKERNALLEKGYLRATKLSRAVPPGAVGVEASGKNIAAWEAPYMLTHQWQITEYGVEALAAKRVADAS